MHGRETFILRSVNKNFLQEKLSNSHPGIEIEKARKRFLCHEKLADCNIRKKTCQFIYYLFIFVSAYI